MMSLPRGATLDGSSVTCQHQSFFFFRVQGAASCRYTTVGFTEEARVFLVAPSPHDRACRDGAVDRNQVMCWAFKVILDGGRSDQKVRGET